MDINEVDIKPVKYKITKFNIIIPSYPEPYELDEAHVGNFVIEKDYENFVFPYMEFRVIIPDTVYRDIMDEGSEIYVDLKLEYTYLDDFYEIEHDTHQKMVGTVFDERFYAFIENKSPKLTDATSGEREKVRRDNGDVTQYSYDNDKPIVMSLYRSEHIFLTDQIVNKVLSGVTLTDTVNFYFKTAGLNKLLMSPADNNQSYKEMLLPPVSVISGLFRLIKTYQLHKKGSILFFDYDRVYLCNKKLGATCWENNEITKVYLLSYPNTLGDKGILKSGFYVNGAKKYAALNVTGNQISVTNDSMQNDVLNGSNITLIDSTTGDVSQTKADIDVNSHSPNKTGKQNQVLVMDSGQSKLEQIKSEIEDSGQAMTLMVNETLISYLVPNKDFILSTDNASYQQLAGHYRITSMGATFTRESSLYTSSFVLTFKGGSATI